ncbi:MAG: NUDIX hydrolase [Candidatus Rokuibacteriota bacterium]
MPVKRPPATPSPAATLMLVRDHAVTGIEILLIQRHRASKFAAGDYVFAGGKVENADHAPNAAAWCVGLDAGRAARVLGLPHDADQALGYWIGAIREAFEEVGVLLAYGSDGCPARLGATRVGEYRRACQADHRAFWDMLGAEGLRLATDQLVYVAHWITPEERPLRFDTRFFAAPMPAGQAAVADDKEIVDVRWLSPAGALAACERGEISLRLPTLRNVKLFEGAVSTADALGRLDGRQIEVIRPRLISGEDGSPQRTLLPGDPGYF